jgi:hypothetical protein
MPTRHRLPNRLPPLLIAAVTAALISVVVGVGARSRAAGATTTKAQANTLIALGAIGTLTWRCEARSSYALRWRADPSGATERVEISRDGGLFTEHIVQPGKGLTTVASARSFLSVRISLATEAVRRQATIDIVLGPVAGECIVPLVQASVSSHTNR